MRHFPYEVFGKGLRAVDLVGNNISKIDYSKIPIDNDLEMIDLGNNPIKYIAPELVKRFPKLKYFFAFVSDVSIANGEQLRKQFPNITFVL